MDVDVRPCASAEEARHAVAPITTYFGRSAPNQDAMERLTRVMPAERIYCAWEGGCAVGGLGAFPFHLTVPGGWVAAAGVSIAGVPANPSATGHLAGDDAGTTRRYPCSRRAGRVFVG